MTPLQYAEDFYAKSWEEDDVYDDSTINHILIKEVDSYICQILRAGPRIDGRT